MSDLSHSFWRTGQFDDGGVWSAANSMADSPTCDGGRPALGKWGLKLGPIWQSGGHSRVVASLPQLSQWRLRCRLNVAASFEDWVDGDDFYFVYHYSSLSTILKLRRSGSHLQIQIRSLDNAVGWRYSDWVNIDQGKDRWLTIELRGKRSPSNGELRLWVDGQSAAALTGMNNNGQSMTTLQIGFVLGVGAAVGPMYLDDVSFVDAGSEGQGEAELPLLSAPLAWPPLFEAGAGGVLLHASDCDRGDWFDSDINVGGDISILPDYALSGRFGYRITYPTAGGDCAYVSRHLGRARRIWGRLFLRVDPSSWDGGNEEFFFVGDDTLPTRRPCFRLSVYQTGGNHYLYYTCGQDLGTGLSDYTPLGGGCVHGIDWYWQAASGAGANDGALRIWVDGQPADHIESADNDQVYSDFVALGPQYSEADAPGWLEVDGIVMDDRPIAAHVALVEAI